MQAVAETTDRVSLDAVRAIAQSQEPLTAQGRSLLVRYLTEEAQAPFFASLVLKQPANQPLSVPIREGLRAFTMTAAERDADLAERQHSNAAAVARADLARVIGLSGLSQELIDKVRANPMPSKPITASQLTMIEAGAAWAGSYPDVPMGKGLAFTGASGLWKSETIRRIAARLLYRQSGAVRIVYAFGPGVNNRLRAEFAGEDESPSIRTLMMHYAEVVFLCDIFKAMPFDMKQWQEDFWRELFDQIDREGRPLLCITANAPLEEIVASYAAAGLKDLVMRVVDSTVEYQVTGTDGREVHRG